MGPPDDKLSALRERLRALPDPVGLLEGLFAAAPVAFQIYEASGRCLLVNDAFRALFGSEPPPEYSVLRDDVAEARGILPMIRRAFAGEVVSTPTFWYDPRELQQLPVTEGRRVAISATFFPLRDPAGKVTHVAIAFKDETAEQLAREAAERRQASAEADERRARFLAEAASALARSFDLRETLRRVAELAVPAFADWCAVSALEDAGYRRLAVLHRDPAKQPLAEAYAQGFPAAAHRPGVLTRPLEERQPVLLEEVTPELIDAAAQSPAHAALLRELGVRSAILVPLVDGQRARGVLSFMIADGARRYGPADLALTQDLAARIVLAMDNARLYQASREAEARFRALVENAPDLAWSALPDGSIDFVNQRFIEYTGKPLHEAQGWNWERLVHPEHQARVLEAWRGALARGEPLELEFPLRGADGSYRWFLSRVRPLRDDRGKIVRWFGSNSDVETKRREAAELAEAVRLRDVFLSVASHELRTPLTSVRLRLEQLERRLERPAVEGALPKMKEQISAALRQANRLGTLVDDLLDVSRALGGRFRVELTNADLVPPVRDVLARFELQAMRAGCGISLDAPDTLPARTDPQRFEQVVSNLVDNALKYGAGGAVEVHLSRDGERAVLQVRDHGIGIPRDDRERIFERFERAVSERNYGGMGLGLYISRTVVEALGGTIRVESEPSRGSTFIVELPLR